MTYFFRLLTKKVIKIRVVNISRVGNSHFLSPPLPPPFPWIRHKELIYKTVCNLPAHTIINDSSTNLTPLIALNNTDATAWSSEPAKPRGAGYLKDVWAVSLLARAWTSQAQRKVSVQRDAECYSKPSEQRCPWIVGLGVEIAVMIFLPMTWLKTCSGFIFKIFFFF